LRKRKTLT